MNPSFEIKSITRLLVLFVTTLGIATHAQVTHKTITPEQLEFFEKNIRPVLVAKCYDCHSEEKGKNKGELTLDTRDASGRVETADPPWFRASRTTVYLSTPFARPAS
jgi:hypothetical protein